ncbi:YD repeat-containing protein [Lysobacter sp. yr284]|uniref:putative Ig domain-containing protein n=1 Tax=Lysobacter sp. yr284 TaxID=1761791 RepID=UPI00089835D3|nr:putative Ig domain-containing protein [Lysobacter sp. yr284]SDY36060.1 YD repeat-containing protein [Lysobacter sp. yr284]
MSAIVSGIGLGLFNGSLGQVGRSLGGSARLGQGKDEQYVNIATGNLVLRSQDEFLIFRGLGVAAVRTYNSRGQLSDSGADAWITGFERRVELVGGALNAAGSVMRRHTGDGSYQDFAYVSPGLYRSSVGDGAHDTLGLDASDNAWVWTEGSSRRAERYADHADATLKGRLIRIRETKSEQATAIYWNVLYDAAGRIVEVAAGESGAADALLYAYDGNGRLSSLSTRSDGVVREQTIYRYDSAGRLSSVLSDLTPDDPAGDRDSWDAVDFANNDGYWLHTVYTYADASSLRIAQVRQSDGTVVGYTYDAQGRVRTLTRGDSNADDSDGVGQTLTFSYDDANHSTEVADSSGRSWGYAYDAAGQLIEVRAPAVAGLRELTQYSYDAAGNVVRIKSVRGSATLAQTVYQYDANGNALWQWDTVDPASGAAATAIQRTWTASNQLASLTVYTGLDADGELAAQAPSGGATTYYVYDAQDRVRFVIGADGAVQEFEYASVGAGAGQVAKARQYLGAAYSGAATLAALSAWASAAQRAQSTLVESRYDLKGRLAGTTAYAQVDASGNGVENDAAELVQYRYDAHGLLLQRRVLRSSTAAADDGRDVVQTTGYVYDGLGRLLSEIVTEKTGAGAEQVRRSVSQWTYLASSNTVRIVSEGGAASDGIAGNDRVRLEVRDAAGQLLRVTESAVGGSEVRTLARHYYDSAGRLRASEDAGGARRYFFYDEAGRLQAEVDATGAVLEYVRDELGRIKQTLAYASRVDTGAWLAAGAVVPAALSAIRPAAHADDRSATRSFDALGRLIREREGDGATTTYSYDGAGRLLQVAGDDGAGNRRVARSFYDAAGRVVGELDAEGYLVEYRYDLAGRRIARTAYATAAAQAQRASGTLAQVRPAADAANDQTTRWFFDGRGNLVGQLDAEGYLTESLYDEARNERAGKAYALRLTGLSGSETLATLRSAAAAGEVRETRRSFDALGRLVAERNAEGTLTRYHYDVQGNLLRAERAADTSEVRENRLRYNVFGELIGELGGEGAARVLPNMTEAQLDALFAQYGVRHRYDALGRRIESTDAAGRRTWTFYDAAGRATFTVQGVADANGVANALGEVSETRYTAFGEVRDRTDYTGRIVLATAGSRDSAASAIAALAYVAASDRRRSYAYSPRGLLAGVTDAEGQQRQYAYNAFDERVREAVLNAGAATIWETDYDRRGLAIAQRDGVGTTAARASAAVYDAFGRLVRSTDARGVATAYDYDRLGRQIATFQTVLGRVQSVRQAYDAFGRTIGVTDALGRVTTTAYDTATRSTTVTTPEGVAVKTRFDRHGQQVEVSAPLPGGAVATTGYVYDRDGRLLSSTDPLGRVAANEYDARGSLVATVDASGRRVELRYDAAGRLLRRIEDPAGLALTTTYRYDGQGRKIETVDASGRVVAYAYDREGRLTQATQDPAGLNLRTTYAYDAQGRQVRVVEGAGTAAARTVQYDYDALGRRVAERSDPDGLNLIVEYAYDAADQLIRRTEARAGVTRYYYDQAGQLIYTIDPLGAMTRHWYDPNGRRVATRQFLAATDAATLTDATTIAQLDARIVWNALDPTSYTVYDRDGRATLVLSGLGELQEYSYDAAGRVAAVRRYAALWTDLGAQRQDQLLRGVAVPGDFDRASLRNDAADQITYHVYTAAGELRTTVDNAGAVVSYVYDRAGRVVVHKRYAHAAQLTAALRAKLLAGTATAQDVVDVTAVDEAADPVAYTGYDGAGRARYRIDANGGVVETLYDATGRIAGTRAYAAAVVLDAALKAQWVAGEAAGVAALATRLAAAADEARDLREYRVYDRAGRLAAVVDGAGYLATRGYDGAGQLVLERRHAQAAALSAALRAKLVAGTATAVELAALAPQDAGADAVVRRAYDAAGRERFVLTQSGLAAGGSGLYTVAERRYDGAGRVVATLRYDRAIAFGAGATVADVEAALSLAGVYAPERHRQTGYAYDLAGRLRFTVDDLGAVTEQRYDALGRTTETRVYGAFVPAATAISEPALVAAVAAVAALGTPRTTVTAYDAGGRALSVADALGQIRRYGYDALGQLRSYTNANGHTWNYDYDLAGRRVAEYSPSVHVAGFDAAGAFSEADRRLVVRTVYDALGNVLARTENADTDQARTVRYDYDNRGNRIRTTFPDAGRINASGVLVATGVQPTLDTAYDAFNRATVHKDTRGNYRYNVYDGQGRLAYEIDPEGYATAYGYDGFGQRTSLRRHAQRIDTAALAGWSAGQALSLAQAQAAAVAGAADRTLVTRYDQRGLAVQVEQSAVGYYTAAGTLATGTPTVRSDYDAYGQKVRESTLLEGGAGQSGAVWAHAYTYYDALGRVAMAVDAEGYLTRRSYNATGELVESVEYAKPVATADLTTAAPPALPPAGDAISGYDRVLRWNYDALGRKTREAATRYVQRSDGSGGLREVVASFGYDGEDRLVRLDNDAGSTTTAYDALGRVVNVTEPARRVVNDSTAGILAGNVNHDLTTAWMHETAAPYTEMLYDGFGNLIRTYRYALGKRDSGVALSASDRIDLIRYDRQGRAIAAIAGNGDTTYTEYDAADNVVHRWYALSGTQAGFDAVVHVWNEYDKTGQLLHSSQQRQLAGAGAAVVELNQWTSYNAFGEILRRVHVGVQGTLVNTYDNAGRLVDSNETGGVRNFGYNLAGQLVREHRLVATSDGQRVDAITWNTLDRLGRVVATRLPAHTADPAATGLAQQRRDRWGNVLETVDARGYRTNYRYNELDQVVRDERPLVEAVSETGASTWTRPVNEWFYDAFGRLIGTRDANGNTRLNEYDAVGQLVRSFDAFGQATLYAYDALGQQRIAQSPIGRLTYQDYDKRGRLVETGDFQNGPYTRTQARLQRFVLNQNGDRLSVADALGNQTRYDYASTGQVARIQTATGQITWYGYDMLGRKTWENYNTFNGPSVQDRDGETVRLDELTWDYDVFGRLIDHNNLSGRDSDYLYDAVTGQLSSETMAGGGAANATRRSTYYANGQVKALYESGATPTYRYEYDAAGNRTVEEVDTVDGAGAVVRTLTRTWYDSNNRVQRVVLDDLAAGKRVFDLSYAYDAVGNRRSVKASAGYGAGVDGIAVVNNAPVVVQTPAARSLRRGMASQFSLLFSDIFRDAEQDPLTLQIALADGSALPSWLSVQRDPASGQIAFTGQPPADAPDQDLSIRLSAHETNNPGNRVATSFVLYVRQNLAPQRVEEGIATVRARTGQSWGKDLLATDFFRDLDVGDRLRLSLDNPAAVPSWMSVDLSTPGAIRLAGTAQTGTYTLTLRATDERGASELKTVQIVIAPNGAPTGPASLPPAKAVSGYDFNWSMPLDQVFQDPDADALQVVASGLPPWLSYLHTANSGVRTLRLSGRVPPGTPAGDYTVSFTATDPSGAARTTTLTVSVRTSNQAPTAPAPYVSLPVAVNTVDYWAQLPPFADADGDALSYSVRDLPAGLAFDPNTRAISGRASQTGHYWFSYTARDPFGGLRTVSVALYVRGNSAPTAAAIPNQQSAVGTAWSYQVPAFGDSDGDALGYTASGLPPGLSISATGAIQGAATAAGNYGVTVTARDPYGGSASAYFVISVAVAPPPNRAPVVTGAPDQMLFETTNLRPTTYQAYSIRGDIIVDPDNNPLTYAIIEKPDWLTYGRGANGTHVVGGVPPRRTANERVVLRATDPSGLSVDLVFYVSLVYHYQDPGGPVDPFSLPGGGEVLSFDMGAGAGAPDDAATPASMSDTSSIASADAPALAAAATTAIPVQTKQLWFAYDAENRVRINNGELRDGKIQLSLLGADSYEQYYDGAGRAVSRTELRRDTAQGTQSTWQTYTDYDLRGNRTGERSYRYNNQDGLYEQISAKTLRYDDNSRLIETRSYYGASLTYRHSSGADGETVYTNYGGWLAGAEQYAYDAGGRLMYQTVYQRDTSRPDWVLYAQGDQANDLSVLATQNRTDYRLSDSDTVATGYDAFNRLTRYRSIGSGYVHTYTSTYVGWEGFQESSVTGTSSNPDYRTTTNTLTYDAFGRLTTQRENTPLRSGALDDRVRYYSLNGDGRVQTRREGTIKNGAFVQDGPGGPGNYLLVHAGGQQLAELKQGQAVSGPNQPLYYTDQVVSLGGLGNYEVSAGNQIAALPGETLVMLAQRVYGDGQLWYVIAEANGLGDPNQELAEGLLLTVPSVKVSRNSAETFKPYSPGEAIGSTTPGLPYIPLPPKDGCGAFATIMMTVVAVAVAYFTWGALSGPMAGVISSSVGAGIATGAIAGAAASAASLGVGSMMGAVSFNWRSVAAGAVAGAVTGGIASQWGGVTEALANSPLKAVGLAVTNSVVGAAADKLIANNSFSWRNVAIGTGFQLALSALAIATSRNGSTSAAKTKASNVEFEDGQSLESRLRRQSGLVSNEEGGRSTEFRRAIDQNGRLIYVDRQGNRVGPPVTLDTPAQMSGDTLHVQPPNRVLSGEDLAPPHDLPRVTVTASPQFAAQSPLPVQVRLPVPNSLSRPALKQEITLRPAQLENLYTPRYGPYEAAYNGYIAGLDDASNPLHIRAMGLAGAVIASPMALADMMTSGIINAPNNANLAGQSFAKASMLEGHDSVIAGLEGTLHAVNAFLGFGDLATLGSGGLTRDVAHPPLVYREYPNPTFPSWRRQTPSTKTSSTSRASKPTLMTEEPTFGTAGASIPKADRQGHYYQSIKPLSNLEVYGEHITRTPAEALAIMEKIGYHAEELEKYHIISLTEREYRALADAYQFEFNATYGRIDSTTKHVSFKETVQEEIGGTRKSVIRVRGTVFESDEHIVQTLTHEFSEIEELEYRAARPVSVREYNQMILPNIEGNLHYHAVKAADDMLELYRKLRAEGKI